MPEQAAKNLLQAIPAFARTHKRSLSGLVLTMLLGLTAWSGKQWLSDPYRFPLQVVEVKGEFRYMQKETLQAAIAPHVTDGFFNVNVDRIRTAAEVLPWVHRAKVRRVWPATLRVLITEQEAVAAWNEDGYLNAAGEIFYPGQGPAPDGLPQLGGPDKQAVLVLQRYHRVLRTLQPLGLQVAELGMDGRRAWSLVLQQGTEIRLGRARPWTRLQRFVRAYPDVFADRLASLNSVDLRYSNGFSVHWQKEADSELIAQRDT